jgi:uncharacterized membrane protein YcaP (DUF421 family)
MEIILRTIAVYFTLMIVFRIAGKRSMAESNTFDFVVLLIISEATQQALVSDDYSVTAAVLVIVTLVGLGVLLSFVKQKSAKAERVLDGLPVVIVQEGRLLRDRMDRLRVDDEDILEAAHAIGVANMDEIRYAIIERNGDIKVIPKRPDDVSPGLGPGVSPEPSPSPAPEPA